MCSVLLSITQQIRDQTEESRAATLSRIFLLHCCCDSQICISNSLQPARNIILKLQAEIPACPISCGTAPQDEAANTSCILLKHCQVLHSFSFCSHVTGKQQHSTAQKPFKVCHLAFYDCSTALFKKIQKSSSAIAKPASLANGFEGSL